MISIKNYSKRKRALIAAVIAVALIIIVGIGLYIGSSILEPKATVTKSNESSSTHISSTEAYEECRRKIDSQYQDADSRWVSHRDYSECSPDIVAADSLSEAQKNQNKNNVQIMKSASDAHDDTMCNKIKGMYYSSYPPNLTKVITRTEDEAKQECKIHVKSRIKRDAVIMQE